MEKEIQYAWAAGLLEGEGCFSIHKRATRKNTYDTAIHCEMTDEDTIYKLQSVFGIGTVVSRQNNGKLPERSRRKPTWIWSVQNKKDTLEVLLRVLPHLCNRRREKAQQLLSSIEERGYDL